MHIRSIAIPLLTLALTTSLGCDKTGTNKTQTAVAKGNADNETEEVLN